MKLYYAPMACSLTSRIAANELGIPLDLVKVDLKNKTTETGDNFLLINPKGCVPALELDDGRVLTEGPAVLQYLADSKPEKNLAAKCGTFERARVQEWLNYLATEIHQRVLVLIKPDAGEEEKQRAKNKIVQHLEYIEGVLQQNVFLANDEFSVADIFLFNILLWASMADFDLASFPSTQAYNEKIAAIESVKSTLMQENEQ